MPGVRIHHPTARNVRYTIVDSSRPYQEPYHCTPPEFGGCGAVHVFKTHHLNLDDTGSVIIESVLFDRLRDRLVLDGFTIDAEVKKPPRLGIGMADGLPGATPGITIMRSPNHTDP